MTSAPEPRRSGWAYTVAILGAFLIVVALVYGMRRYAQTEPLTAARAAERAKALAELRSAENEALRNAGWIDQGRGVVRLRIDDAMALVQREWGRDPAAGRSNLLARVAKIMTPPPKPPEQPSAFE